MWFYDKLILVIGIGALLVAGVIAIAEVANARPPASAGLHPAAASIASTYKPQTRDLLVTAVPLLVHEQTGIFDYLKQDFGKGGLLRGREVWAWSPNTLTVYQGDTVRVTVSNPGGDDHTFTITQVGFSIKVPAQSVVHSSFVVPRPGVYKFFCSIPEHMPYMWGSLVVLPDSAAPQS